MLKDIDVRTFSFNGGFLEKTVSFDELIILGGNFKKDRFGGLCASCQD
jgi:hypothetical protein